jgi:hypothetical protein
MLGLRSILGRVFATAVILGFVALMFPLRPAAAIVSQSPCIEKCLADYEIDAIACGKIDNEARRKTCQDAAHVRYKSSRENCEQKDKADDKERCKKQCDKIHDRCHADCTKNDPTSSCHAKCNNEYAECLRECDRN